MDRDGAPDGAGECREPSACLRRHCEERKRRSIQGPSHGRGLPFPAPRCWRVQALTPTKARAGLRSARLTRSIATRPSRWVCAGFRDASGPGPDRLVGVDAAARALQSRRRDEEGEPPEGEHERHPARGVDDDEPERRRADSQRRGEPAEMLDDLEGDPPRRHGVMVAVQLGFARFARFSAQERAEDLEPADAKGGPAERVMGGDRPVAPARDGRNDQEAERHEADAETLQPDMEAKPAAVVELARPILPGPDLEVAGDQHAERQQHAPAEHHEARVPGDRARNLRMRRAQQGGKQPGRHRPGPPNATTRQKRLSPIPGSRFAALRQGVPVDRRLRFLIAVNQKT